MNICQLVDLLCYYALGVEIEIGFFQDSYTVTEGEAVTVTYGALSSIGQANFVFLDLTVIPNTASKLT